MSPSLQDEIRQNKPFASLREEMAVNLRRSAAAWESTVDRLLEAHDLTTTQYNVLRILRGAPDGLCRQEISDRMVSRTPDATRLLDRMEEAGLITRTRSETDRRMVNTTLTNRGRQLVDALDTPVTEIHNQKLGHLSDDQARTLNELLTLFRTQIG